MPRGQSKNRRKFDRATLLEFIADNGVVMDLIPNECCRDTRVSGQCVTENCNNRFEKPVRSLFDYGGPYCKNCTKKNREVKFRETCIKNHGVENPLQSEEIRQKVKETCVEKYGVENPFQSEEIKQKVREAYAENLGVENPSQSEEIKQKKRETCVKNHGVENPMQSEEIKQKSRETNVEKYGVEHPMQNPEQLERAQIARFKRKIYKTPTGQLWRLQGYEHLVAPKLIEEYGEESITPELKEVPCIPWFDENGQMHYYFCDFYVEPHKLVVEVKSPYTRKVNDEKIQRTRKAANDLGYAFRLIVVDRKGELIEDNTFEGHSRESSL